MRFARTRPILAFMTELDQVWSQMLDDAVARAGDSGRDHVADYLRLRATNDSIRRVGVGWLIDTFIEIALDLQRFHSRITIDRHEPHNFARGSSNMVGSLITVRNGVRSLAAEAGWARTPSDGIMLKGSLAFSRISHFGMPKAGVDLRLVHAQDLPQWITEDNQVVDSAEIRRHFDLFIGS